MTNRLKSIDDFWGLRDRLRLGRDPGIPTIIIPAGTCGQASGANDLIRIAKRELLARKLTDQIHLCITGCHGFCETEPCVVIEPRGTYYPKVGIREMERIIRAISQGKVCEELLYVDPDSRERIEKKKDIPFFRTQARTLLSRGEKIDPIRIYHYIENDGYSALAEVLARRDPAWVLEEVKASGLRGRGGAGFPTGLKWEMLSRQPDGRGKILVCNADEGDPGAYMDRSLLEGNPHSIIEGMIIGAFATGATEGIVYVRDEYPLAIKHLIIALRQARELGLLGENILGTGFSFSLDLMRGAGAFVCGEETALIQSIEGKMGEPRQRPPLSGAERDRRKADGDQQRGDLGQHPGPLRSGGRFFQTDGNRRAAPGPRSSAWWARCGTRAWWRSPWEPPSGRSCTKSAAARRAGRPSRRCRPAALPGGAFPRRCSTFPSTMTAWPRPARSWGRAG